MYLPSCDLRKSPLRIVIILAKFANMPRALTSIQATNVNVQRALMPESGAISPTEVTARIKRASMINAREEEAFGNACPRNGQAQLRDG